VEEILRAAERATMLTQQLLAFSRKQVMQPRPLELNAVIGEDRRLFERLLGEDVRVVARLCAEDCWVMADPGQMHQVLMNLVANARDAMPQGGELVIETAGVYLDDGYAATHAEAAPGCFVMIAVSDTGMGMDAETLRHLFEPFFTTKGKGRGTGLGLSTVYGIVRQNGGWINSYSEPGRGTTLKIYLPRIAQGEGAVRGPRPLAAAGRGRGTLLVVEDQQQVRQLATRVLAGCGYRVLEAESGEEALQLAAVHAGGIDLLLTDVIMPGMSGKELAERLAEARPEMRVLFMSGYTENVILHRGVLDAGVEYLAKPFTPETLVSKVAEVLARGRGQSAG
jgi:CheY-like chemotaxis protein